MHPRCTAAQTAAAALRGALVVLRDHVVHPWLVEADLYEVDQIIAHLDAHSADLELKDPPTMPVWRELDGTPRY